MTAFFVSRIKVKDPIKMQEYAAATGPTIAAHSGALVLRGGAVTTLIGEDAGTRLHVEEDRFGTQELGHDHAPEVGFRSRRGVF